MPCSIEPSPLTTSTGTGRSDAERSLTMRWKRPIDRNLHSGLRETDHGIPRRRGNIMLGPSAMRVRQLVPVVVFDGADVRWLKPQT